jgi:pimeloyl-ACP methyl ester carboxylesterase
VIGRSSGGFGALRLALDYPGSIAAVAAHSADSGFDLLFKSDLTTLCDKTKSYSGDIEQYVNKIRKLEKVLPGDVHAMMLLGSAGFYSANPKSPWGFDLPIDLHSGEIDDSVWSRWLAHDPINRIKTVGDQLKKLKYLYIECGLSDQFRLLYGARQMHTALKGKQVLHDYEEFPDNHSGTDYRFNVSIPRILKHIS